MGHPLGWSTHGSRTSSGHNSSRPKWHRTGAMTEPWGQRAVWRGSPAINCYLGGEGRWRKQSVMPTLGGRSVSTSHWRSPTRGRRRGTPVLQGLQWQTPPSSWLVASTHHPLQAVCIGTLFPCWQNFLPAEAEPTFHNSSGRMPCSPFSASLAARVWSHDLGSTSKT